MISHLNTVTINSVINMKVNSPATSRQKTNSAKKKSLSQGISSTGSTKCCLYFMSYMPTDARFKYPEICTHNSTSKDLQDTPPQMCWRK